MTSEQFLNEALPYLVAMFPEMEQRVVTAVQMARWVKRFGHLDMAVWHKAVDTYADDKHYPPTVNGLMEYVPPDYRTGQRKPDDPSRYDVRTYAEFPRDDELPTGERVPAREVKALIGDLMQKFNDNEDKS